MKKRFLLSLLPLALVTTGCSSAIVTPEGLDLLPYQTSIYVTPNGTSYTYKGEEGITVTYEFGSDAIVYSHTLIGKVDFNKNALAVYYFEGVDQIRFAWRASRSDGKTTVSYNEERHFHFFISNQGVRACYEELSPAVVYYAS